MPDQRRRAIFPLVTQILAMSLGLVAFILSAVAVAGCEFISPSGESDYGDYGLFKWMSTRKCVKYNENHPIMQESEGVWRASQAMGAISAVFGALLWVACILMLFLKLPHWAFKTIGWVYAICFVTQMLTFVAFAHSACSGNIADLVKLQDASFQCDVGPDGIASIFAALFYLGIGITMLVCPTPATAVITCWGDCCREDEGCACCGEEAAQVAVDVPNTRKNIYVDCGGADYTITETYNKDGSVTVRKETINPDGSKSITVTTVPKEVSV